MSSFDERAATWDEPVKIERARVAAEAIARAIPLDASIRLLEYGAGTGLVSQALAPAVGPITMADTSAGMREVMAAKVTGGELPGARVWDVDLSVEPPPDERFDLVVTMLALHHIEDPAFVLEAFVRLLEPGGHVAIVDLDAEDGSFHRDFHHDGHGEGFHGHNGFARDELRSLLEAAGFRDVQFHDCGAIERDDRSYPLFLATART